jgi:maltose phosphorylase
MNKYLKLDEWKLIEEGFNPENQRGSESLFSLGNGRIGQRANFEEKYSGNSLQGNYVAGVYYPDKTRVGWWKNGYPEYFAKVLNAPNWVGINVWADNEEVDLAHVKVDKFTRILNMRTGLLERHTEITLKSGKQLRIVSKRFLSMHAQDIAAIKYSVTPLNFNGLITFLPFIDADIKNEDSNYDEKFWNIVEKQVLKNQAFITTETKKTLFHVCNGMIYNITKNHVTTDFEPELIVEEKFVANKIGVHANANEELVLYKYASVVSSRNIEKQDLLAYTKERVLWAAKTGFEILLNDHIAAWEAKWRESDIVIEGDIEAQQGIRFNIFQLNQTYTGDDPTLNIGPKGFTGEKYGGSTYWDTEAYCLPFYLSTADPHVARNLLKYRYNHLEKAIENAEKLGFKNGAALYPMVTMNGEECHNEWEITFEEIHRNGAIAYAIYNYINYTDDKDYLAEFGLEVLIGISRFWAQRVNYSEDKKKYVMLGVTGPNEYENNVNNNWYTNKIATWTLKYTQEAVAFVKKNHPARFNEILQKTKLQEYAEPSRWTDIINNMYFPADEKRCVFLQQDGFLDKEIQSTDFIPADEKPINQNWSWDRILRSCYIKQADVLQGVYFFEYEYDSETIRKNFDFYEPITVHESSLSPCIYSVVASKIGNHKKAYELYLRTARLDLDDYNDEVYQGCHITSMAGTWLSIVEGFAGKRVKDGRLHFNPGIPRKWLSYSFAIRFRGSLLSIKITRKEMHIENLNGKIAQVAINGKNFDLDIKQTVTVEI